MAGTSWRERAACARRTDLDWFDLDCNLEACLNVCVTCPVADHCLDEAARIDAHDGIWGGLAGGSLRALRRKGGGRG